MLKNYIKKVVSKGIFLTMTLFTAIAWSQTAVVTSVTVPTGDISNGSYSNTIYGFRVDVGTSDINLQNLTVNFGGVFGVNTPDIRVYAYDNRFLPFDPNDNTYSNTNFGALSVPGTLKIVNNWGLNLSAGQTYYFFIKADFYDQGTLSGIGSTISASLPSLASIEFTSGNTVTVTGSVTAGQTYNVVKPSYIITPIAVPARNIQSGSQYVPILGYKIEAPANVLSSIVQNNIIATVSGTYISSADGIDLTYAITDSPVFDLNNWDNYTSDFSLNSNSGMEEISVNVNSNYYIYKTRPKYIYLLVEDANAVPGHTISAKIDPAMFSPSITGAVFSGNTFTFTSPVATLSVNPVLNTNGFIATQYTYNNLYTFAITAPANDDFVFTKINVSFSGVTNSINNFSSSGYMYLSEGQVRPVTATGYSLNSLEWNDTYYGSMSSNTITTFTINARTNEIIPAGQTRYFTLADYSYTSSVNNSIQVLGVNQINGTTFSGISAAGGIKTTSSIATFHSVNTNTAANISPFGEQLIYQFNGNNNSTYYYTNITKMVVTLTGNVDPANIASVNLRSFSSDNNSTADFTDASTFSSVSNPGSKVITFSGNGGYMYYYSDRDARLFITVQLNTPVNASIAGQTIGVAAIDESAISVTNPYITGSSTVIGSNFQTGAAYTYSMPSIDLTLNALPASGQIGINQSITPVYSVKINASGNAAISSVSVNASGTYTSSDIDGFYLYGSNLPVMDQNASYITDVSSNSTGTGETLSFNISNTVPKGVNYFFIVPIVRDDATVGRTMKIEAIPTSAFVLPTTLIGITSNLPAGDSYTIAQPMVTFTGIPAGGGVVSENGYVKSYTIEVNSNVAFVLNKFAFNTNGMYSNSNGLLRTRTYFSPQMMETRYDDALAFGSYRTTSSLSVLTNTGETFQPGGTMDLSIPQGKSYITIFSRAGSGDNQSFGVSGIETSITTVLGATIVYINNVAGTPTTILGQVITINSVAIGSDPLLRGLDNQVIYAAKYISNAGDAFNYFGMWLKGTTLTNSDFKVSPDASINIWLSTSSTFSTSNAVKMSDPANGATSIDYSNNNWYEFNNQTIHLEANTQYYIYATVDISATATIGNSIQVYGEDPGDIDNEFEFEPRSSYNYDYNSSVLDHGVEKVIIGESAPMITFTGGTLTVGGASLDLSTVFATNSTGAVTYSITSGTAATLDGTNLAPVSAGTVTVTVNVASAPGFNAGSKSADFLVIDTVVTSITEILNATVVLYPNPSSGTVKISGDFDTVTVLDVVGSTVFTSRKSTLDLSALSDGLYFVKITKGNASVSKKLILRK